MDEIIIKIGGFILEEGCYEAMIINILILKFNYKVSYTWEIVKWKYF